MYEDVNFVCFCIKYKIKEFNFAVIQTMKQDDMFQNFIPLKIDNVSIIILIIIKSISKNLKKIITFKINVSHYFSRQFFNNFCNNNQYKRKKKSLFK